MHVVHMLIETFNFFSWPIIQCVVPMTAAVYGVIFSIKTIFTVKRLRLERDVAGLIVDLDNADSAIRKNICYLRETNFLRGISKEKWLENR